MEMDEVFLGIDASIACGLILNELLTNAYKYAYPEKETGEIGVSFKKKKIREGDDGSPELYEMTLTVKDSGAGIPDSMDIENPVTLGLSLVKALVENQLEGILKIERKSGTEAGFSFRTEKA